MMQASAPRARSGFTLIEMLVVIIVIGLLAGLVGPRILGRVSEAKTATARTQIELLGLALDNYRLDNGSYPTTEQGPGRASGEARPGAGRVELAWPLPQEGHPRGPVGKAIRVHQPGSAEPFHL